MAPRSRLPTCTYVHAASREIVIAYMHNAYNYSTQILRTFSGVWGGSSEPPEPPPSYALVYHFHIQNNYLCRRAARPRLIMHVISALFWTKPSVSDRFVCGLRSDATRRKLLTESKLTFARAVELTQSFQQADKNSKSIQTGERDADGVREIISYAYIRTYKPRITRASGV